jgi:hypothetical protein
MQRPYGSVGLLALAAILLSGCDLSRSDVERILNDQSRGDSCQSNLKFVDGGFANAKSNGKVVLIQNESGFLGQVFKVADLPAGDRYQVIFLGFETNPLVTRKIQSTVCLPGHVEVTAIADAPFAPIAGSYKLVDFVEVVTLPAELQAIQPYVFLRYSKQAVFQKTDASWRVAH